MPSKASPDPLQIGIIMLPVPNISGHSGTNTLAAERQAVKEALLASLTRDVSDAPGGSKALPLSPERCIIAAMWSGDIREALRVRIVYHREERGLKLWSYATPVDHR